MQAYKVLYLDKAQGAIFGLEAIGKKSGGKKDPNTIEINEIQRKKGKSLQYYQIYAGKGFKNKSKIYNTVDCYNKSSNKDKYPYKTSFQKPFLPGLSMNKNQSFRVWLMKMLEENSNNPDSPFKDIRINSMLIEKIPDPVPLSGKEKRTPKLDFLLGLQSIMSMIYSQREMYSLLAYKSWKQYWNLVIIQCATRLSLLKFQLYFGYIERKYRPRLQLIWEPLQTSLTELLQEIITQ